MTDHQNSVHDVVDDNGTLRKHTQYDTFGRITDEEYFDTAGDPVSAAHAEAESQKSSQNPLAMCHPLCYSVRMFQLREFFDISNP